MADPIPIRVEVPVCAFRPYASREYQDTFPVPPPSSVYGMLLSLLGVPREHKDCHRGAEMAIAVELLPGKAKVFRKLRRGDDLEDTRPDYQDLLMDLTLWVWLRPGTDSANPPLSQRVPNTLADSSQQYPASVGCRSARVVTSLMSSDLTRTRPPNSCSSHRTSGGSTRSRYGWITSPARTQF